MQLLLIPTGYLLALSYFFYSAGFYNYIYFYFRFVGYPGNYVHIFGLRNEECNTGGCLLELAQQLIVIMIGKQIINNCQEVAVP